MAELLKKEEQILFALRDLYRRSGYSPFKMSKFEAYELYMQNKDFLVSDGVITFTDADGTLMALKPDVTLSIVKNFRGDSTPVQKVYYNEQVYRNSRSNHGFREIMQTGLECLGNVDTCEICEVILLAVNSLQTISSSFVLDISHMQIVSDILSQMELSYADQTRLLQAVADKNEDGLVVEGVDTTPLRKLLNACGPIEEVLPALENIGISERSLSVLTQLKTICELLRRNGLSKHVQLDFSIVNDMNYYNGIVFRGYVEGIPNSILAGGQYDKLMDKMGKNAGGIGFAVYLDQLERLDVRGSIFDADTVLLYDSDDDTLALLLMAQELRSRGDSVLLLPELPEGMQCRRVIQYRNGRAVTVEENG